MKPHKHAELIKAWADGAEIEVKNLYGDWVKDVTPNWTWNEYRIKPEPKPDVVRYGKAYLLPCSDGFDVSKNVFSDWGWKQYMLDNLKLTFDGETGKLKSAEVLK